MRYLLLLILFLFSGSGLAGLVNAEHYQQFWLWAGVKPQPVLINAKRVYLLQAQISHYQDQSIFEPQGQSVSKLVFPEIWLAYRVHTLSWSPDIIERILAQRRAWIDAGNVVAGIQLDFDARSLKLADYAVFLRTLHQQLPNDCQLSITGLLDWSKTGDIDALNQLNGVIDELVVQTYRGKRTEPNYQAYLSSLNRLTIPFKVGLIQRGEWDTQWQAKLADSTYYRGEVVFLVN